MQEREWLKRIAAGEEAALEHLYFAYQPRLARFLQRFTSNTPLIEEVINDVLFVVWTSSAGFRGDSSPSTWIFGIAYKKMLKAVAKSARQPLAGNLNGVNEVSTDVSVSDVGAAVQRLPYAQGAVVVLTYEFGYSYREIGEILGCPENTVKTRMLAARKSLKKMLET